MIIKGLSEVPPTTYYVYKRVTGGTKGWPKNWTLHAKTMDLAEAERLAAGLCPKGCTIDTEGSKSLEKSFFGSVDSENWSAMITVKDIHAEHDKD